MHSRRDRYWNLFVHCEVDHELICVTIGVLFHEEFQILQRFTAIDVTVADMAMVQDLDR